jgi:hypothetical protein
MKVQHIRGSIGTHGVEVRGEEIRAGRLGEVDWD